MIFLAATHQLLRFTKLRLQNSDYQTDISRFFIIIIKFVVICKLSNDLLNSLSKTCIQHVFLTRWCFLLSSPHYACNFDAPHGVNCQLEFCTPKRPDWEDRGWINWECVRFGWVGVVKLFFVCWELYDKTIYLRKAFFITNKTETLNRHFGISFLNNMIVNF